MNAKAQEFIDKMIEKQKGEELKQREKHLKTVTAEEAKTIWANAINITATIFLVLNIIGAFILAIEFGWLPIVIALTYCVLWYPIIIGFSKIVAAAEKKL